jgi:[protein-PII] uridylyltransferase
MVQRLKEQQRMGEGAAFIFEAKEEASTGCWEIAFLAKDRPGLFSDLAGVLALNNINVLSAQIYTWQDGTAVDIFQVSNPPDPIHADETWEKIRRDLEKAFKGKLSLAYRLDQKSKPSLLSGSRAPSAHAPRVIVDNISSDFFTLIEVIADDRVGLLYLITRSLFDLRLDIRIAKIATKADQIADVFYVRDLEGQKLEDEGQVEEIKRALVHQLEKD